MTIPRPRPSFVAAPPLTRSEDAAEGAEILHELPTPAGLLLWEALRDGTAWVHTRPARRPALAVRGAVHARKLGMEAARPDPELWSALAVFAVLSERPESPDVPRLLRACANVAAWAEQRGAPATRLAFTQLAALLAPDDPEPALETAKLARERADYARAESWFRTAIRVARKQKQWEMYIWGYIGLGILYMRTGNYPAASAVAARALRTARHFRARELEAVALHHLFVFAAEGHQVREAYEHALSALQAYGNGHARVPALAQDIACFWTDRGNFIRAVPVFSMALPLVHNTNERALVAANLARASAGAGYHAEAEQACQATFKLIEQSPGQERISEAFLNLARAFGHLGDWPRAREAAQRATEIATRRGEAWIRLMAEDELHAAQRKETTRPSTAGEESPVLTRYADKLATHLLKLLREAIQQ